LPEPEKVSIKPDELNLPSDLPVQEEIVEPSLTEINDDAGDFKLPSDVPVVEEKKEFAEGDHLFIEKGDYSDILSSFTTMDNNLKDSVSKTSLVVDKKNDLGVVFEDFRLLMEDMERKIVYMDNVLLKER